MQTPDAIDVQQLLAACRHHLRAGTENIEIFCELGQRLRSAGREQEARRCYKRSVELLLAAARRGDADLALHIEQGIYLHFVRPVETEEHYYRCFSDWRDDMARLGRRLRVPANYQAADPAQVAFILMGGQRLGHSEVLLRYLTAYLREGERRVTPVIYTLHECTREFTEMCARAGVRLVSLVDERPDLRNAGTGRRLHGLRERLASDRIACAVWVSVPTGVSFAFSLGLAPVQILWALRFHPVAGPYIDGYLTYGSPGERERRFGKQSWRVVPTPLAIETPRIDAEHARRERARFSEAFLFGTVAREDKIRSPAFLAAVAAILKACPEAGYVWTGRDRPPEIEGFFHAQGVAGRCHFAGWVDAPLYAGILDVFLETFPLGCGVTGYQALGAGTPLLSYLEENTVFGMQYWHTLKAGGATSRPVDLSAFPILCAATPEDYVALACRLASDRAFRASAGERGRTYFERENDLGVSHANAFFRAIEEVICEKLGPVAAAAGSAARPA